MFLLVLQTPTPFTVLSAALPGSCTPYLWLALYCCSGNAGIETETERERGERRARERERRKESERERGERGERERGDLDRNRKDG